MEQALETGIVHWPATAKPGEKGNVVLVGHSSTFFWQKTPYGQIFAALDKLTPGDLITIFYHQKRYLYQVEEVNIVPFNSIEISLQESDLTLITCWPPGTTWQRLVVKAKMI
jgi:sortase A